ncbi:hypothetical protein [Pontivivens ytuae]|uniref:Uncharacterized protein n=1 Tax=Pontivivens ytuae TaxID=2789856 RepID=A0A7S9QBD3_9RHOB|nr:hypothetical protein [Pontivivens ytuae]QPH52565.1 hypothetical protein I0K15_12140 [Pontivivens ytuae]
MVRALAATLVLMGLTACVQERPIERSEIGTPGELNPGPGLLSGEDGEFVFRP